MPPGFDASWSVDPGASYSSTFGISQVIGGTTYGSMVFGGNAAQRAAVVTARRRRATWLLRRRAGASS